METFSALLAFWGNSPVTGKFLHRGQWRWVLMFSLICAWISGWVISREAGDLRRHCAHYDAIVMVLFLSALHVVSVVYCGSVDYGIILPKPFVALFQPTVHRRSLGIIKTHPLRLSASSIWLFFVNHRIRFTALSPPHRTDIQNDVWVTVNNDS